MVAVIEIKTFVEKDRIMAFLRDGTVPTDFKHRSGLDKFKSKCQYFVLAGEQIFFKKDKTVKKVIVKEDLESITSVVMEEHSINHLGNILLSFF